MAHGARRSGGACGNGGAGVKPLTATQVEDILKAGGFVHVRTRGSHFIWVHPESGLTTTVPHHGNRALQQGLLNGIFRDANLPRPQR